MKRINELKMVKVFALDWAFTEDCRDLNHKFDPIEAYIVGFLVEETKEKVVIAHEGFLVPWRQVDEVRRVTAIPKCNIKKIEYLEVKEKEIKHLIDENYIGTGKPTFLGTEGSK